MARNSIGLRIACFTAVAVFVADVFFVCWSPSFDKFLLLFLVAPIASLTFMVLAIWVGRSGVLPIAGVLLICLAVTYGIARYSDFLRSEIRWWAVRGTWKQRVLAQPEVRGQLKHLDWDGWGFAGEDTEVYLVYDPADRLGNATVSARARHGAGLPCNVWKIWRLEPHWYNVVFFTNTSWDSCS
jgi:hypothetical protein